MDTLLTIWLFQRNRPDMNCAILFFIGIELAKLILCQNHDTIASHNQSLVSSNVSLKNVMDRTKWYRQTDKVIPKYPSNIVCEGRGIIKVTLKKGVGIKALSLKKKPICSKMHFY